MVMWPPQRLFACWLLYRRRRNGQENGSYYILGSYTGPLQGSIPPFPTKNQQVLVAVTGIDTTTKPPSNSGPNHSSSSYNGNNRNICNNSNNGHNSNNSNNSNDSFTSNDSNHSAVQARGTGSKSSPVPAPSAEQPHSHRQHPVDEDEKRL